MSRCRFILIILFVSCYFNAPSQIQYGNNEKAGKYINLNGANIYYETYGEGRPLILIHGNSTPIKGFTSQIEFFSKKYKVYAMDCRGRGKSQLGNDSLTYFQMAKDFAEFINQLKLDSVYIVGKSDGGIVALMLAMNFPEHISKIVSFSANVSPDTLAFYPKSLSDIHEERIQAEKMLANNDTTKNWMIEKQRLRMMEFQPHISALELNKINIPVLIMSTDGDVIKTEHTIFIYRNIPHANLCIVPGETHSFPRLNPSLFNEIVDRYLSPVQNIKTD